MQGESQRTTNARSIDKNTKLSAKTNKKGAINMRRILRLVCGLCQVCERDRIVKFIEAKHTQALPKNSPKAKHNLN